MAPMFILHDALPCGVYLHRLSVVGNAICGDVSLGWLKSVCTLLVVSKRAKLLCVSVGNSMFSGKGFQWCAELSDYTKGQSET